MKKVTRREDEKREIKKITPRCDLCKKTDVAFAAKLINGTVKWVCYNCYRDGGKRK